MAPVHRHTLHLLLAGAVLGGSGAAIPARAQESAAEPVQARPIIPDAVFDASLPAIDPDPQADMGSLADWEEEFERLSEDPELTAPLVPLEDFEAGTFDESFFTQEDEGLISAFRYRYRIDGLNGLGEDSAVAPVSSADIRRQFAQLSVLAEGNGRTANAAMLNLRLRVDGRLLADILASHGYYDARVRGNIEVPAEGSSDRPTAVLTVRPGPRYVLGTIQFDAPPVEPPDLITSAFRPKPGEPIVAERILAAEANIAVVLPQEGYPFVKVGQRDILLDDETGKGDYTLPVSPGLRSRFGEIVVAGDKPLFAPDHIATIARFEQGELYDARKVDDLRRALIATGLFGTVAVEPEESAGTAGDGTADARLVIRQEAGPARTIAGQAGYATGQGLKVEASWTHRNMFPPEGALILNAVAGTQEQGAGATFRRSNAGARDRTVELGLSALRSDFDAYEAYTGRLAGRISRDSTPIWLKRWSYSYGFELLLSSEQDYDFDAGARSRKTYAIAALPGHITYDTTGSLLDPVKGMRLSARLSPEVSRGRGTQTYGRAIIEASAYQPFSEGLVLAGRARVGMIAGAARADIAPSRRLYAGGGGSVRGFGYQELGPKDPENRPIGGRSLVEAAGEVRYRFGDYGVVGFVDAGQVYTSQMPRFSDWRFGIGVGGRFYTNFGPMRVDVATPINRQPGESRISVYVSIGQAF